MKNLGVLGHVHTKNWYDVRPVDRRAPGVCFLLGFSVYLFVVQNGAGIPDFG